MVESMFHLERRNKENKEEKKERKGGGIKTRGRASIILFVHNGLELGYIEKKRGWKIPSTPNVLPVHNNQSIGSFQFFQLFCPLDSKSRVKFISVDGTVIVLQA